MDVYTPAIFPNLPDSPLNLEVREEEEILKNEVLHSVATALASIVLPVPRYNIDTIQYLRIGGGGGDLPPSG